MTTKEFIKDLDKKLKLLKAGKPLALAVAAVHGMQHQRIFDEALNSSNAPIGQYSTKLMLASQGQFVKKSAFKQSLSSSGIKIGKRSKKVSKRSKGNRKLWIKFPKAKKAIPIMMLEGGYKQFRNIQGRRIDKVDLKYTGFLQKDFANSLMKKTPLIWISGIKNKKNIGKVDGAVDKYGKTVFELTKFEKAELLRIQAEERKRIGI